MQADRCQVGGKNASLGELTLAGLPVPPGFAIPPPACGRPRPAGVGRLPGRAICFRRDQGYPEAGLAMSVVVQKMVPPRAAGVAFTLNPADGDRSQVAIDASWGFGEAVVSGEVNPDNFLVDKVIGAVGKRTVSRKEIEDRLTDGDRVEKAPVQEARPDIPFLTDAAIKAVAAPARRPAP